MKAFSKIARLALILSVLALMLVFAVSCGDDGTTYKVTFISEGDVYDTITVKGGTKPSLPPEPYKEGYNFVGWFLDEDLEEEYKNADITADTKLYAKWVDPNALPVYQVTLNLGDKGTVPTLSVTQGNTVGQVSLPETPGYYVVGWYTDAAHTTPWNITTDPIMGDMTLYAAWDYVTYHAYFMADGTLVRDVPFTMETETLTDIPVVPSKNGYNAAWETYTLGVSNVTVNAVYTPISYTITYEGLKGATNPNPATYTIEDTISLSTLTTSGFLFVEWQKDGAPITTISAGTTGNITLTAIWEVHPPIITYIGALGNEHSNPTLYRVTDGVVTLTAASRTWYDFIGWYADAAYTTPVTTLTPETIMADTTLYAKWEVHTYKVYYYNGSTLYAEREFDINNQTWDVPDVPVNKGYTTTWTPVSAAPTDLRVDAVLLRIPYDIHYEGMTGATHTNPETYNVEDADITLTDPVRAGYDFLGWYEGATPVTVIDTSRAEEITLTAMWKVHTYRITYTNLKGVDAGTFPATFSIEAGVATLPTGLTTTGYTFVGWTWKGESTTSISSTITEDVTLTAVWSATPYTITYEGLLTGDTNTNPATYTIEDAITLVPASRRGYRFTGWTKGVTPITTISAGTTGAITLTANWEVETYSITYENVKGLSTDAFPHEITIVSSAVTLPTNLTVEGYAFAGWKWNGQSVTTIPAGTAENVVLTAEWTLTPYTITYEGLLTGDTNTNPATYTIEDAITLVPASRRGYRFTGWTKGATPITTISAGTTGAITLTANWEVETYSITYENVKGLSTDAFPHEITVVSAAVTLPTNLTVEGYAFAGWKWNGQSVTTIPAGTAENVVLTAEWTLTPYTITYEGLLTGDTNTNPATYTIEDAITLVPASRRGYHFTGWTKGVTPITTISAGTTGAITLTANWEVETYTITYENTKGADISTFPTQYTIETGAFTLPTLTPPNGYTFLGWAYADGTPVTAIAAGSTGNIVVKATYETTAYIVTLHPMGGSVSSKNFTVNLDTPFTFPVPRKEGYIFLGWYENTGDSTQLTDENGQSVIGYPYVTNRIIYAHYTPVQHKVYFNTNGGNIIPQTTYAYGTTFDPTAHIAIKGDGAYFAGWYTADELICYDETTKITSDVTLYAKWMESTPISTAEEFLAIQDNPNGTYHLTQDITLRGDEFVPWNTFNGILDGNDFALKNFTLSNESAVDFAMIKTNSGTIKNLTISGFTFNSTHSNIGGMSSGILTVGNTGTIENCTITNGVIKIKRTSSYNYSASGSLNFGIFAAANTGTIKNCVNEVGFELIANAANYYNYNSGSGVTLTVCAGGIVGQNKAGGVIELCRSTLTNTTSMNTTCNSDRISCNLVVYMGGVVAANYGTCRNSYADFTTNINGTRSGNGVGTLRVGGFVGYNSASIEGCSTVGSITGGFQYTCYIGGFVGHNDTANGVIRSSHSDIDISNGNFGGEIGGFVGNNTAKIMTSYASGDVSSNAASATGGFVGYHHDGAVITQSFASGNVQKPNGSTGAFVGTISSTGTTRECFFLDNATLMINGVYVEHTVENGNIIGKTYLELLSEDLLIKSLEWDGEHWILLFDETPVLDWEVGIGHTYTKTVIEPNCEDFGYTVYQCTHCTRFYISEFTNAWGHSFAPEKKTVVDPTCTEGGYTSEVCLVCKKDVRSDYKDPTGHTSERVSEHVPPTCTEEGHNTHVCRDCGTSFIEVLPAIGHDRYVTIQYKAPSCSMSTENGLIEVPGHTAQYECDTCGEILEPSVPVAPHSFKLQSTTTPATCTEDGMGVWVCEYQNCKHTKTDVIKATGHQDANRDGCCDNCKLFLGFENVDFIEIKTAEDLLQISENPSAAYRLMNDIDLNGEVFTALCSARRPFTGYFDGNGKTIKNLNASGLVIGGLFGYNAGTIRMLTISGVTAELTADGTFGAIAAYNDGTISDCTVTGIIRLSLTQKLVVNEKVDMSVTATACFGGITAVNGPTGVVYGCKNTGTVDLTLMNTIEVNVKSSVLYWIMRNYKTYFTSSISATFGGIAGTNSGLIESCKVSTTDKITYNTIAGISRAGGIKFGYATIEINGNYGVVAGYNGGTMVANTEEQPIASNTWVMFNSTEGNTWADNYDVSINVAE